MTGNHSLLQLVVGKARRIQGCRYHLRIRRHEVECGLAELYDNLNITPQVQHLRSHSEYIGGSKIPEDRVIPFVDV